MESVIKVSTCICSLRTFHLSSVPINVLCNHFAISDAQVGTVEMSIWIFFGCLTLEEKNRQGSSRLIFGFRRCHLSQMLTRGSLECVLYREPLITL